MQHNNFDEKVGRAGMLAALTLFTLLAVGGCGLKYDLYLPPEQQGSSAHSQDSQITIFDSGAAESEQSGAEDKSAAQAQQQ